MLKFPLAPFAAIGLTTVMALAQEPAASVAAKPAEVKVKAAPAKPASVKRTPIPVHRNIAKATPVPVATPIPKKPGFWERVFGKKKPTTVPATPTPAPVAKKKITPKPRSKKPKVSIANPENNSNSPDNESTTLGNDATTPPKPEETEKPSTPKPVRPKSNAQRAETAPPSTDNPDAEIVERQKYDQAKAKAVADPKVQELRGKADAAASEEESRKALRAYNKAMFKRMKEIDPSIKDHVDRMEAAVLNRLGAE